MSDRVLTSTAKRRATVLLLDDDPIVVERIGAALPREYYDVSWAATSDSAFELYTNEGADLAIIDIDLGQSSGWDFVERLRASEEDMGRLPVIMMTGSSEIADRETSLRLGADRYLVKPVTADTLRRVVNELLAARSDFWWALSLHPKQVGRLRELLYDPTTEVPTIALVIEDLREMIERGDTLNVFCIEIEPLFSLGERNFWDSFDVLRREFVRGLQVVLSSIIGNDIVIATSHPGANDFYCFSKQNTSLAAAGVMARELEKEAKRLLRQIKADPLLLDEVAIFVGGATTHSQPLYAPRILYTAVREAKDIAERRENRYFQGLHDRLMRALREKIISTHFQPIIDLTTEHVVGYEALSRGPMGTDIESPEVIFGLARDFHLVWDLETLCIQNVQPMLRDICSRGLLFFNLESHFIQELHERGTDALSSFLTCGSQVVIEVTERSAIRDYRTFRNTLHDLKAMGFKIAIDDCGSGYATLEAVAELHPDYLKVGHSLFQKVERDPIRRRLVELVARCADTIGAVTIAEAIETEEQLRVCQDLNIALGQGFLFARPAPWEQIKNQKLRA